MALHKELFSGRRLLVGLMEAWMNEWINEWKAEGASSQTWLLVTLTTAGSWGDEGLGGAGTGHGSAWLWLWGNGDQYDKNPERSVDHGRFFRPFWFSYISVLIDFIPDQERKWLFEWYPRKSETVIVTFSGGGCWPCRPFHRLGGAGGHMVQFLGCLSSPRFWTSDPSIDVSYGLVCVCVCVCVYFKLLNTQFHKASFAYSGSI